MYRKRTRVHFVLYSVIWFEPTGTTQCSYRFNYSIQWSLSLHILHTGMHNGYSPWLHVENDGKTHQAQTKWKSGNENSSSEE